MRVAALQASPARPAISTTSASGTGCNALTMIGQYPATRAVCRLRPLEAHRGSRSVRVASAAAARESSAAVTAAVEIDDHREEPANIHNINNFPDMCIIRQGFAQLPAILVARCRSRWLA